MNWFLLLVDYFQEGYHLTDADRLFEALYKVIVDSDLCEDIFDYVIDLYNRLLQG